MDNTVVMEEIRKYHMEVEHGISSDSKKLKISEIKRESRQYNTRSMKYMFCLKSVAKHTKTIQELLF